MPPVAIGHSRRSGERSVVADSTGPAASPEIRSCATGSAARWSPEQVSRSLRGAFPVEPGRWLCAETIYQAVYRPDLGGLSRELPGRVLHQRRRQRLARRHAQARRSGPLIGMTPIADRPAAVLARENPGTGKETSSRVPATRQPS
jgi:IS30 family transposase